MIRVLAAISCLLSFTSAAADERQALEDLLMVRCLPSIVSGQHFKVDDLHPTTSPGEANVQVFYGADEHVFLQRWIDRPICAVISTRSKSSDVDKFVDYWFGGDGNPFAKNSEAIADGIRTVEYRWNRDSDVISILFSTSEALKRSVFTVAQIKSSGG